MNLSASPGIFSRSLRLCYWNAQAKVVDRERLALEEHLKRLGQVKVVPVKTLEDSLTAPCDLLIVGAQQIPAAEFPRWLSGLRRRVQVQGAIWTPALIMADVSFDILAGIWTDVTKENWYFDILAPDHMASLPIRVANLLRIHDHLHEMKRYGAALDDINRKVAALEAQLPDIPNE